MWGGKVILCHFGVKTGYSSLGLGFFGYLGHF